jgi:hypothetical protein
MSRVHHNAMPMPEPSVSAAEFMRQAQEQERLRQQGQAQVEEYPIFVHGDNFGDSEEERKRERRQKRLRLIAVSAAIAGSFILGTVGGHLATSRYTFGGEKRMFMMDRLTGKTWLVTGSKLKEILSEEELARRAEAAKPRQAAEYAAVIADPPSAHVDKVYQNPETGESIVRHANRTYYSSTNMADARPIRTDLYFVYTNNVGVRGELVWDLGKGKWITLTAME